MKNIFCQPLTLDFDIDTSMIDKVNTNNSTNRVECRIEKIDERLENFLSSFNLMTQLSACFYTPPNFNRGWNHVDSSKLDNMVKLNYIIGGENTVMRWFKFIGPEDHIVRQANTLGDPYAKFVSAECELIWEEELTGFCLVNAGIPHNIQNNSSHIRWSFSYGLLHLDTTRLQWNEIDGIFKNYYRN
jgi:hypothetical protein